LRVYRRWRPDDRDGRTTPKLRRLPHHGLDLGITLLASRNRYYP
jgi:hypothetical protein